MLFLASVGLGIVALFELVRRPQSTLLPPEIRVSEVKMLIILC